MALTADEILEHAKALPPRERLELVERVVHSLVETQSETEDEAAMDRELERRIDASKSGATVSAEEVIARLRARG
jgi:putative addiction module component (TIGR02574 family)